MGVNKSTLKRFVIGRAQVGQEAPDHETDPVNNVKVGSQWRRDD